MATSIDPGDAPSLEQPLAVLASLRGVSASFSQTRANNTTSYTAGDVLGGILLSDATVGGPALIDFSFPTLPASGGEFMITSTELERDVAAIISGETTYNLYLYNKPPVSGLLDNAVFDIGAGDRVAFVGKVALGAIVDEVSTLYVRTDGVNQQVTLLTNHLYGYLVTVGAYQPAASTVLKVTVHGILL